MARIAGVDIPQGFKRVVISLTYVFGIGRTTAEKFLLKQVFLKKHEFVI